MRKHIYAVYGLVRIADEIVDTYRGNDALQKLDALEQEVYESISTQYSVNPIVQSFVVTAKKYTIREEIISPFFQSMRVDLAETKFSQKEYKEYIYGSAEVVGLMCLRVFTHGDDKAYGKLQKGAAALGSAYQKVNFLRDIHDDYTELHRMYFPGKTFSSLQDSDKQEIIEVIQSDFAVAILYIDKLPASSRRAVRASYLYYTALLNKLSRTPISDIKKKRIRIPNAYKFLLLIRAVVS